MKFSAWLVAVLFGAIALPAFADCAPAMLSGPYSYAISGSVFNSGGSLIGFFSTVGVFTADGKGALSGTSSGNTNGVTTQNVPWTGTYAVNADCSGTATINVGGQITTYAMALGANGEQIYYLQTSSGIVGTGTATRQALGSALRAPLLR